MQMSACLLCPFTAIEQQNQCDGYQKDLICGHLITISNYKSACGLFFSLIRCIMLTTLFCRVSTSTPNASTQAYGEAIGASSLTSDTAM